jgi:hypothetical protein
MMPVAHLQRSGKGNKLTSSKTSIRALRAPATIQLHPQQTEDAHGGARAKKSLCTGV